MSTTRKKAPAKKTTAKRKTATKKTGTRSTSKNLTPAEKRKRTIARKNRQTGATHVSLDKGKQAKRPGKRVSASGRTYYERRANHSDVGKLLGSANVFANKSLADAFVKEKNKNSRTYTYYSVLYPINKGGDGKAFIVRKRKKSSLNAPAGQNIGDTCTRRNADGSTTTYSAQGGNRPCPYGGRPTVKAVTMQKLSGTKPKTKKKPTPAQLKARAEFTKKQAQARKLFDSGKAKTMSSAWAMIR